MRLYVGWIRILHPATRQPGPWIPATREDGLPSKRPTRRIARSAAPPWCRKKRLEVLLLSPGETPTVRTPTL